VGTLLVFGTAIAAGAITIALVLIVAWLRRPPRGGARDWRRHLIFWRPSRTASETGARASSVTFRT